MNKPNAHLTHAIDLGRFLDIMYASLHETPEDRLRRRLREQAEEAAERAAELKSLAAVTAVGRADQELYDDVIEALVAEGKAVHVAANLVNNQVKLLAEAKRLQII